MTNEDFKMLLTELKALKENNPSGELSRLFYDLWVAEYSYKNQVGGKGEKTLTGEYVDMFDSIIWRRISSFTFPNQPADQRLAAFKKKWSEGKEIIPLNDIHFGQMRVAPTFAGEAGGTKEQQECVGFPKHLPGSALNKIRMELGTTILRDQIPLFIFKPEGTGQKWICADNRGYTVHCWQRVRPMRLIPRYPTDKEKKRLEEKVKIGGKELRYPQGYSGTRLKQKERTLPSLEMPITNEGGIIENVVSVPVDTWS